MSLQGVLTGKASGWLAANVTKKQTPSVWRWSWNLEILKIVQQHGQSPESATRRTTKENKAERSEKRKRNDSRKNSKGKRERGNESKRERQEGKTKEIRRKTSETKVSWLVHEKLCAKNEKKWSSGNWQTKLAALQDADTTRASGRDVTPWIRCSESTRWRRTALPTASQPKLSLSNAASPMQTVRSHDHITQYCVAHTLPCRPATLRLFHCRVQVRKAHSRRVRRWKSDCDQPKRVRTRLLRADQIVPEKLWWALHCPSENLSPTSKSKKSK